MGQYIDKEGVLRETVDTLTKEEKVALMKHIDDCFVPLIHCPKCWEYYMNVGHEKYTEVLTRVM